MRILVCKCFLYNEDLRAGKLLSESIEFGSNESDIILRIYELDAPCIGIRQHHLLQYRRSSLPGM